MGATGVGLAAGVGLAVGVIAGVGVLVGTSIGNPLAVPRSAAAFQPSELPWASSIGAGDVSLTTEVVLDLPFIAIQPTNAKQVAAAKTTIALAIEFWYSGLSTTGVTRLETCSGWSD